MDFLSELRSLSTLIEVAVLWVALYAIMRFLRKTRGFGLLRGLASTLLVGAGVSLALNVVVKRATNLTPTVRNLVQRVCCSADFAHAG